MIGGSRVDFWRNTLVKRAFVGGSQILGVAATNSHVQLWNPAESGIILICTRAIAIPSAATLLFLSHHNAALTGATVSGNKYLAEAVPTGSVRIQTNAGNLGTVIARQDWQAVPQVCSFIKDEPFIIGEGLGLNIIANTVNITLDGYFEWIEA